MEACARRFFNHMLFEDSIIVANFCIVLTFHQVTHRLNEGRHSGRAARSPILPTLVSNMSLIFVTFYLKLRNSISEIKYRHKNVRTKGKLPPIILMGNHFQIYCVVFIKLALIKLLFKAI